MGIGVASLFEDLVPSQDKIILRLNETQNEYESAISKYEATIEKLEKALAELREEEAMLKNELNALDAQNVAPKIEETDQQGVEQATDYLYLA